MRKSMVLLVVACAWCAPISACSGNLSVRGRVEIELSELDGLLTAIKNHFGEIGGANAYVTFRLLWSTIQRENADGWAPMTATRERAEVAHGTTSFKTGQNALRTLVEGGYIEEREALGRGRPKDLRLTDEGRRVISTFLSWFAQR